MDALKVVGCHATTSPLNFCVADSQGTITLIQTGCTNQVTWDCGPPTACD